MTGQPALTNASGLGLETRGNHEMAGGEKFGNKEKDTKNNRNEMMLGHAWWGLAATTSLVGSEQFRFDTGAADGLEEHWPITSRCR